MTTQNIRNPRNEDSGAVAIVGNVMCMPVAPAPLELTFRSHDNTTARLTVNKDRVTFEGNPDAAAAVFLDSVTRRHADQWLALNTELEQARALLAGYAHHNGMMMLAMRLVAAERERDALREKVNQSAQSQ